MKLSELFFRDDQSRIGATDSPEKLPGYRKKSFSLPYAGGEIWFEHLDGIYQYTELALSKLEADSGEFLSLSKPSPIGFVLDETVVTLELAERIAGLLCGGKKKFTRVCFIGTNRQIERLLRSALSGKSDFAFAFINDFDRAKDWLVSEDFR